MKQSEIRGMRTPDLESILERYDRRSRIAQSAAYELQSRAAAKEARASERECSGHVWSDHRPEVYKGMRGPKRPSGQIGCLSCGTVRYAHLGCCDQPLVEEMIPEGDGWIASCLSCGDVSEVAFSRNPHRPSPASRRGGEIGMSARAYQRRDRHS